MTSLYEPPGLRDLVKRVEFMPRWLVYLGTEYADDGAGGLHLFIVSDTEDSMNPGERMRVRHGFLVPAASYNEANWTAWVFDRFRDVLANHEAGEFFRVDGVRVFAPHHGNGEDPYRVWHVSDHATAKKRAGDA